jgi:hypothetical protein
VKPVAAKFTVMSVSAVEAAASVRLVYRASADAARSVSSVSASASPWYRVAGVAASVSSAGATVDVDVEVVDETAVVPAAVSVSAVSATQSLVSSASAVAQSLAAESLSTVSASFALVVAAGVVAECDSVSTVSASQSAVVVVAAGAAAAESRSGGSAVWVPGVVDVESADVLVESLSGVSAGVSLDSVNVPVAADSRSGVSAGVVSSAVSDAAVAVTVDSLSVVSASQSAYSVYDPAFSWCLTANSVSGLSGSAAVVLNSAESVSASAGSVSGVSGSVVTSVAVPASGSAVSRSGVSAVANTDSSQSVGASAASLSTVSFAVTGLRVALGVQASSVSGVSASWLPFVPVFPATVGSAVSQSAVSHTLVVGSRPGVVSAESQSGVSATAAASAITFAVDVAVEVSAGSVSTDATVVASDYTLQFLASASGANAVEIPAWADRIDVVAVGGGGGGSQAVGSISNGAGGNAGKWSAARLVRGTNFVATQKITVTVGAGGKGGSGGVLVPERGKAGSGSSILAIPTSPLVLFNASGGDQSLIPGTGLNIPPYGSSPGNYTFNGVTYVGGVGNQVLGANGTIPGVGGNGAEKAGLTVTGTGGDGGNGSVWLRFLTSGRIKPSEDEEGQLHPPLDGEWIEGNGGFIPADATTT